MQIAGRWIAFVALTVVLLIWGAALLSRFAEVFPPLGIVVGLLPLFVLVGIAGAGLWLAGWIVEGFAKK